MNLAASSVGLPLKSNLSIFHSLLKSQIDTINPISPLILFRQFLQSNLKPNDLTFSLLLKSSASSRTSSSAASMLNPTLEANQIHTHLIKSGIDQFVYVSTALLDLYAKFGLVEDAHNLFDFMPDRDVVSWNALICGYSRNGYEFQSLELFVQMLRGGFRPRQTTLVGLVPSCGQGDWGFQGKSIHGLAVKAGLDLDSRLKNAFTSMYAKCGDLVAAKLLFQEILEKSVISWNTMIGAFGKSGLFDEAMLVFKRMVEEAVQVNPISIMSLLSADASPQLVHCYSIKTGLASDASVVTSLVCTYAKCRKTKSAEQLYQSLPQKNLVSLTAIISSHVERGNVGLALDYFAQIQPLGMKVDSIAMVSILHGITEPDNTTIGLLLHSFALRTGLDTHSLVANGLISMYFKFNDAKAALSLFSAMQEKPVITWNSMISGCVQTGRSSEAMNIFCQMKMFGHRPDGITIASLLSGCSQLGFLQFGERLHNYVLRNNIEMEDFVETAIIDMYTKCGSIVQAERVFKSVKNPCLATWNTMISGYSWYGFEHKALICYSEMRKQGLEPDDITFLGVLAACTHGGLVHEGRRHFQFMTEEFGMVPSLQHCACMVSLLGRAGLFEEAIMFIKNMDTEPDSAVWGALLSACCIHREVKLGEYIAKKLYLLDHKNGGLYVLMSNLYATTKRWDDVTRVREMMRETGGDGCSGVSQIEVTALEESNSNLNCSTSNLNKVHSDSWDLSLGF